MTDINKPQEGALDAAGAADEFVDEALQAQIRAAFDAVEPSEEAAARMRVNLLARELHTKNASSDLFKMPVPAAREAETVTKTYASPAIEAQESSASETDTGEGASETQEAKPKAKRPISPWKIVVPAAAVLAIVGIVIAVGPLAGILNPPAQEAAKDAQASSAVDAAYESVSEDALLDSTAVSSSASSSASSAANSASASSSSESSAAQAEASSAAAAGASSSSAQAEEAAQAQEEAASASSANEAGDASKATEAEEAADADAAEPEDAGSAEETQETEEENHARDYPDIKVFIDQEYRLVIDSRTPVAVELRGDYIADATAYNEGETASMSCTIFARTDTDETSLISYLGEEKYYPAHVVD